ncbi:protein phosphatase 2C domain-containing protein [Planococcus shixiaomingii]|uniref:protein phosphatase 2C domain-containing protein n=1 Tax=Planococcus shixiaomingii TaxID=3058393 RepID=UPI003461FCEC
MEVGLKDFKWVGSEQDFVDEPDLQQLNEIIIGRFGGNSKAGQYKNEDACIVWANQEQGWEFVMVLDAHHTAESAELVVEEFHRNKASLENLLVESLALNYFKNLEERILAVFQNEKFRRACQEIQGETACMIVVRKGKFVWWFSIGDCILYLFHRELAAMGQFQLNQRHFYE